MKMVCINCPKGCEMEVEVLPGGEVKVSGNSCPRGETYAKAETTNPTRMVTALVRIAGVRKPLPVKTRTAVPKGKIGEVLAAASAATAQLPVAIGDVIVADVASTGVDLVATANA